MTTTFFIFYSFSTSGENVMVSGLNTDSCDEQIRETSYKIFLHPDPKQEQLLQDMLNARHTLAQICGFPTYAHR